jgi:hypothetical protein
MTRPKDTLTIRSYRSCFRVERRIYKLDRWRLPVPWGVPLRGLGYAAAALAVVVILSRLPEFDVVLGGLHPAFRLLGIPFLVAYGLCSFEPDGRAAHRALTARAGMRLRPRHVAAGRAAPVVGSVALLDDVTLAADERGARYRRARVVGPCRVVLRYPGDARRSWRGGKRLVIRQTASAPAERGTTVKVPEGHELWLR